MLWGIVAGWAVVASALQAGSAVTLFSLNSAAASHCWSFKLWNSAQVGPFVAIRGLALVAGNVRP